jgi:hypothetical protein
MASDIKDHFAAVKETNEGWRANCPMCGDSEKKLYWNVDKGVGCCFHSECPWFKDRGGVTEYRLKAYFEKEGIEVVVPEVIRADLKSKLKLPEGFRTLKSMPDYRSEPIYDYLDSRGLRRKIVNMARVGYVREGDLWGYMIFPVFNFDGQVIYWQGRRFKNRKSKFYNPTSSVRDEILYQVRWPRKPKTCIVVESIINVLTLESNWGEDDAVIMGTFGTSITEEQFYKILEYNGVIKEIVLALDPDALRVAFDFADRLGSIVPKIKVPMFPDGEDVNSLGFKKSLRLIRDASLYNYKNRTQLLQRGKL